MAAAKEVPLVYSCSGCSSAAQIANGLALRLDKEGIAEMSCIAGVGGDVEPLVKVAKSGREILALDGCPLQCVKKCLARHGLNPSQHFILTRVGVKKRFHSNYDEPDIGKVYEQIVSALPERRGEDFRP
ncbi:MAG: zinc-binding protein [Elusimicrobia bacterium RIFCSPLOWO2_01_FULL_54_10]|nr:MAG: zinc-binding protein [Elusimicrobia bacterium RIFCSPLOWO2_01_FULL_54_10]